LTGRENIYLNGAILGMNRQETKKKFDEIVSFAEIERFLDTPVKRYSSGMYVRLAFAVAAHLDPEILIVDEVLSVGDAKFQKKCLGKMESVGKEGRTVLFVSHNMTTISSLCDRGLLLNAGEVIKIGNISEVILSYYSEGLASPSFFDYTASNKLVGDSHVTLLSGSVVNAEGDLCQEVSITEPIIIRMRYNIKESGDHSFIPNFHFFSSDGSYAFVSNPRNVANLKPGIYDAECHVPGNFLNEGTYVIGLAMTSVKSGIQIHFYEQSALSFNVKDPIENVPTRNGYAGSMPGIVRPLLDWQIRRLP
jgi:lipopolysaccharide transport system ATP-binding protein